MQLVKIILMSERAFLFFVGAIILSALYFSIDLVIFGLCLWLLFEGMTNIRLTAVTQKIRHKKLETGLTQFKRKLRFSFDASRAWRLSVSLILGGSFLLLQVYQVEVLWFVPWFMGFAIMGAGASGMCPMLLFLRWVGFR